MNIYAKYTNFVKKNRKKLLLMIIIANIVAFLGIMRIHISADFNVFMLKDSEAKKTYDRMNQIFQSSEQLMLMIEFDDNLLDLENLKKIYEIQDLLKSVIGVKNVIPPLPEKLPVGFGLLDMRKISSKDLKKVIDFIQDMKDSINIKERDGKYYIMYMIIPGNEVNVRNLVKDLEKKLRDYKFYISGNSYLEAKIFDYILLIVFTLPPVAFILILNIFRWQIGNLKATFFSVMPAGIAALWTMGILGWTGRELSIVTVLVPIFTIVMGSADGLHFVSHFLENKQSGLSNVESLSISLESVGKAMIMTTLTTMAGFLSLATINSNSMVQMGIFASMGIGLAAVATWFVLPVMLVESKDFKLKKPSLNIPAFFEFFSGKKALFASLFIIIAFLPGLFSLKANFNVLGLYKSYTKVKKNVEKIQEVFESALPVFLIYSDSNVWEPKFANSVIELQNRIKKIKGVQKIVSVYDIVSLINERLYGQKGYPQILPRVLLIKKLLPSEQINNFVDHSERNGRSMIFLKDLNNRTLNDLQQIVSTNVKAPLNNIQLAGIPFIIEEMNNSIIPQQINSVAFALLFVFILLLISQKNFITPFLSIIPISITLIALFGFMGYFGIDLNIVTVTIASIVIGVSIDYSIHFVEIFKYYHKKNKTDALKKTFKSVSKPILANALGLAIGLTAMFFSPLMIHSYLAAIMWVTMLTSSFVSLTLLPFLIRKIYFKNGK